MKTIEEAAIIEAKLKEGFDMEEEKYYQSNKVNVYESFKSGVGFAQKWIPVEYELPEDFDNLTQTEKYTYTENPVLVRTVNGKYTVSKRSKFNGNENSKWEWMGSSSFSDSVTHWRPIERH